MKSYIYTGFIISFLLCNSVFSQHKISIEYGVSDISEYTEEFKLNHPEFYEFRKQQKEKEDAISFFLNIDGQKAIFFPNTVNENDDVLTTLLERSGGKHIFYTDLKNKESSEYFEYWKKKFIIESKSDEIAWTITGETKKINDYLCYKATKPIALFIDGYSDNEVVEAYYTEEIPISFGPKNYHGLPGLVLELREGEMSYYVKKINLNSDITVSKPMFKGEKTTPEQFQKEAPAIRQRAKQIIINSRG